MGFGLPAQVRACLFDLDGVLTATVTVHQAAWKLMFDDYLRDRARAAGTPFVPFEAADYAVYVDGRPRADGARSFLASRGIVLPEGTPDDPPDANTVGGLANRKTRIVVRLLGEVGIKAYPGSERYVRAVRGGGLRTAVVSASRQCKLVLASAGMGDLFEVIVDGSVAWEMKLAGKPAPDTYLTAARLLGVTPAQAAVFEDALAGVEAGRAGTFKYVIGVDRANQAPELLRHGADVVVKDLAELLERP